MYTTRVPAIIVQLDLKHLKPPTTERWSSYWSIWFKCLIKCGVIVVEVYVLKLGYIGDWILLYVLMDVIFAQVSFTATFESFEITIHTHSYCIHMYHRWWQILSFHYIADDETLLSWRSWMKRYYHHRILDTANYKHTLSNCVLLFVGEITEIMYETNLYDDICEKLSICEN